MLDRRSRGWFAPIVAALASPLDRWRISPDLVTSVALIVGLGSAGLIAAGQPLAGLALFGVNRLLDGVDGELARRSRRDGTFGGLWDFTADMVVYVAIPISLAIADEDLWPAAAMVCAAIAVNVVTVLASEQPSEDERRSVALASGLVEGTETIVAYVVIIAVPPLTELGLWVFAAAVGITAASRLASARARDRSGGPAPPPAP
ncbi:MAG: CDP-alcohol phosphatidyltransferase family protein [Actinomycetota bacterium]